MKGLQDDFDNFKMTNTLDVNHTNQVYNLMLRISNKNNYINCLNSNFVNDSWIPSATQSDIPCKVTPKFNPPSGSCSADNFTSGSVGSCHGCLDSTEILY